MQTTMQDAFIADWQNYLGELGLVISWDTHSEMKLETTVQAELSPEAMTQETKIETTRSRGDRMVYRDR